MVSVVIPSRNAEFLQRTIDDLFAKAKGEIEVIVVLDGFWPDPPIINRNNLIIIHHGEVHNNKGMRFSINAGMAVAKGSHVMKIDEHCIVDEGWDEKLLAD
jgi:glycosyltransferase involved in cell wall biosynthesis